jgi:hypothetical protein
LQVPVRYVGEQHVKEDLGRIPTAQDWLLHNDGCTASIWTKKRQKPGRPRYERHKWPCTREW